VIARKQLGRVHVTILTDYELDEFPPWTLFSLLLLVWRLAFGITMTSYYLRLYVGVAEIEIFWGRE
jgi:hypothetical protein